MSSLPIGACRRCGARILWVITANDAKMPLDAEANPAGNVFVRIVAGVPHGIVATKAEPRPPGVAFMPHFATCPALNRTRKEPAPPKPAPPPPPPSLLDG